MADQLTGFHKLTSWLNKKGLRIDLDTGTLLYCCAVRHKIPYEAGDYGPSVRAFQRLLIVLHVVNKWTFTSILDGKSPEEKLHEHARRQNREGSIKITSTYIAMCAKVCREMLLDYVVAPEEADMQVGRRHSNIIAMGRDSDLIGYGHRLVVMIDSYHAEKFRIIDLTVPVDECTKDELPLYYYYNKYGCRVIHWWAAVMGCDVSENQFGIQDIGRETLLKALESFENKPPSLLTEATVAEVLVKSKPFIARIFGATAKIQGELERVCHWFTKRGTYYDTSGNVYAINGELKKRSNRTTHDHMVGYIDPKTGAAFTGDQNKHLERMKSHNLLHKSYVDKEQINGLSLPEGKATAAKCTVDELKAIIIARGGTVTGKDGNALKRNELICLVNRYFRFEKQNTINAVYFDRSRKGNGIFTKLDTGGRVSVPGIINNLLKTGEHEPSIQKLFTDLLQSFEQGKVTDDYTTISLSAPDLKENFIWESFAHVGDSTSQKTIRDGLWKVMEMQERIYHAIVNADDGKSMYIISKQQASQTHDETTRKKTPAGEKPLRAEYLVMMHLAIQKTTQASHGHTLGLVVRIMRSYCGLCKAGCGMCIHRSGALWMQHMHWGEGRPTPKPPTADFCPWVPGSNCERTCTTLLPACRTTIQKLPSSNEEARRKSESGHKKTMHVGESARYDWHGGDKRVLAITNSQEYTSKERLMPLFLELQAATQEQSSNDEYIN